GAGVSQTLHGAADQRSATGPGRIEGGSTSGNFARVPNSQMPSTRAPNTPRTNVIPARINSPSPAKGPDPVVRAEAARKDRVNHALATMIKGPATRKTSRSFRPGRVRAAAQAPSAAPI